MNDYLVTFDNEIAIKRAEYLGMKYRYDLENPMADQIHHRD